MLLCTYYQTWTWKNVFFFQEQNFLAKRFIICWDVGSFLEWSEEQKHACNRFQLFFLLISPKDSLICVKWIEWFHIDKQINVFFECVIVFFLSSMLRFNIVFHWTRLYVYWDEQYSTLRIMCVKSSRKEFFPWKCLPWFLRSELVTARWCEYRCRQKERMMEM